MDRIDRLVRLMPGLYRPGSNLVLNGILQAIAAQDQLASTAIDNAKDQLYVQRAVGNFLDYLANNLGISRPTIIQFIDASFRELIPVLSYWPKQVKPSIYKALELFWNIDYLHSTVTSGNFEPFNFAGGKNLTLVVDGDKEIAVSFLDTDFANSAAATAQEVVDKINAWLPDYVIAHVYNDVAAGGNKYVKISALTYGIAGIVQVTGGTANVPLAFDLEKHQYTRVSLHELNPNELIVRIPREIILALDTIKWAHRFHIDSTIIDSRPLIDAANPYWPGHFFFDRLGSASIELRSTATTLNQVISKNLSYGLINVVDSSSFPVGGGYVVFNFGLGQEVVKYVLRPSNTTLLLDATHIFQHNYIVGTTINYCLPTAYQTKPTGDDLEIFFLDTGIGRQLVEAFILLLKAAGIVVRWVVE